ncbi:5'-methylthioadenosine/adenosylhomocysteine nucleosidase [Advenella alkanexedens]|uniref:5'-methylthioadenosine/adenosylhomocysteine nucleosidase n=1 Tax=Advenella alkanexedens TaxID=1481665 RepID=UPI0026762E79|nr:5'-methylthioadenosine/adenosylhomocysteine nucleosidase [Advenella alkanexedens]WKU18495.1 5'-methylthioadenosine/adenosylhomocysteine nucleosidase [Advenella alkanexedens]
MSVLGIIAALHQEIASLLQAMGPNVRIHRIGQRDYHEGTIMGRPCVVVLSRVGKVAAAATTVTLIREFKVNAVLFTGVAGSLNKKVKVGDVVVATQLLQYDINASPLFPRYEVPLLGVSHFDADSSLSAQLQQCAQDYIYQDLAIDVDSASRETFKLYKPQCHTGIIISGDCFVNDINHSLQLQQDLPAALCVEMEGASVAQVCYEYEIPFAIARIISDHANGSAHIDFNAFLEQVARFYSAGILRRFLNHEAPQGRAAF